MRGAAVLVTLFTWLSLHGDGSQRRPVWEATRRTLPFVTMGPFCAFVLKSGRHVRSALRGPQAAGLCPATFLGLSCILKARAPVSSLDSEFEAGACFRLILKLPVLSGPLQARQVLAPLPGHLS